MSGGEFLLYGAYGYTGALIAEAAVERGLRPCLAGRDAVRLHALARRLRLPYRVCALDDAEALTRLVADFPVVLHCAGPFVYTAEPMARACLQAGAHYLDITGEVEVFEALASLDEQARRAGVMLLPGVGFDVVPTDCLAVRLHNRLPTATHLALAFWGRGSGTSHGTALTLLTHLHRHGPYGWVRRAGQLQRVPLGWPRCVRVYDDGRQVSLWAIPWGDVSTAYYSTGVPNITVYTHVPRGVVRWWPLLRPWLHVVRWRWVYRRLRRMLDRRLRGPSTQARARGETWLWGEARADDGRRVTARLRTPEGYTLTVHAALHIVRRVLGGQVAPGFQTPARMYGAEMLDVLPGVQWLETP